MYLNNENRIAKVLSGNATESDRLKLDHWINESAANRDEFEKAKAIWEKSVTLNTKKVYDADKAWNKFMSDVENEAIPITKSTKYTKVRIAAAIALFLVFALILKINFSENVQVAPLLSENINRFAQPESIDIFTEIEEIDTLFNLSQTEVKSVKKHSYKRKWVKTPNFMSIVTGDSAKAFLLPDNSIVFLNANSKLEYLTDFTQKNRHVTLFGEAYFQVPQDSGTFSVDCENTIVRTLEGSFNIKSYQNDKVVEVIVANGMVEFSGIGSIEFKKLNLNAGETGIYSKDKKDLIKSNSSRKNYKWWQKSFRLKIKNFFDKLLGRTPSNKTINQVK